MEVLLVNLNQSLPTLSLTFLTILLPLLIYFATFRYITELCYKELPTQVLSLTLLKQ